MQPVEFDGSRMIGKPNDMTDDQCFGIPAYSGIDGNGFPFWLTAWKPSFEDLESLKRGEPVWVKSISRGLVPMSVFTMNEKGESNDAG
jgi:hypothetical protein